MGNLHAQRDFTDVRDVVKAYWLLLDKELPYSVFNVCSGKPVAIDNLLAMFQELVDTKVSIVSEQERMRSYDVPVVKGSYDRLKEATGWTPSLSIRQTLHDVFEYWRGMI